MADDHHGFTGVPLAHLALAGQNLDLLTATERAWIEAYAHNGFERINQAMRGQIPMTSALAQRIAHIRSGLRKYPAPVTVRVSRVVEAAFFGITDEESADAILDEEFYEPAFLSTSGLANPPRSRRTSEAVIVEMLVPKGTPALRLGELAEVRDEREVLLIDARRISPVHITRDEGANIWRVQAIVMEGES